MNDLERHKLIKKTKVIIDEMTKARTLVETFERELKAFRKYWPIKDLLNEADITRVNLSWLLTGQRELLEKAKANVEVPSKKNS